MGLRPLEESRWFEFDDDGDGQLATKAFLLDTNGSATTFELPESVAASRELACAVVDNLQRFHPERPRALDPNSGVVEASRLVPDDLCVMEKRENQWRLTAASVCFPSRWRLQDKVNATLDEIHEPVPGYDESLGSLTRRFFERVDERGNWRLNWTLLDDDRLFLPGERDRPKVMDPAKWFFRVERQTLRRLPITGAVIFTIRTRIEAAETMVQRVDGFADDVLRVLESAPPQTLSYKGWTNLAPSWREWFSR